MASPAKLRSPPPSTPTRIDPAQQKMAVVSSNEDGIIQSVNGYACALFGYDKESMLGKNVNMLMPSPYKEQHNDYILRYLRSKRPRVLGRSRAVEGVNSDGIHVRLNLTLSEICDGEGRLFIACFTPIEELSVVVEADKNGIVTDISGDVFGLLGYERKECIGKNVSMFAVEEHRVNHDAYIRNYQTTKVARAMNKTRNLKAKHKTALTPINICFQLTEYTVSKSLEDGTVETQPAYRARMTPVDEVRVVVTIGPRGEILSSSSEFEILFGYSKNELVGQTIAILLEEPSDMKRIFGRYTSGTQRHMFTAKHHDGSSFGVSVVLDCFTPDSGDAAYAGLDQVFRATITRIGKKKLKDKMGRDIVKEGEDMGHYVYGKVLGSGYFGNVRRATHRLTGQEVAIKTLRKRQYVQARMKYPPREVEVLEALNHPKVNRLLDKVRKAAWMNEKCVTSNQVELDDRVYLVLELVEGRELCEIVEKNVLPVEVCRELWRQLLIGVEYMHSVGIVHRDLKLENLMVGTDGNLKIIDLGFGNFFTEDVMLTTFCGSPDYAAPELFKGRPYAGPPADIWSLGVCLFAMMSGCLPFVNTAALCAGRFKFHPAIPEGARDLISMILKVRASDRPSITELKNHPWTCEGYDGPPEQPVLKIDEIEEHLVARIEELGFRPERVVADLQANCHNEMTTSYYLIKQAYEREAFRQQMAAGESASKSASSNSSPSSLESSPCVKSDEKEEPHRVGVSSASIPSATTTAPAKSEKGASKLVNALRLGNLYHSDSQSTSKGNGGNECVIL